MRPVTLLVHFAAEAVKKKMFFLGFYMMLDEEDKRKTVWNVLVCKWCLAGC